MVTAVFTDNDDYARTYGLWQWDYGQQLRIEGLHLPTAVEIHFALQETGGEAIPRVGTTKDGITTVTIPDSMLEGNRAAWTAEKAYNIYAWIYLSDQKSGETIKRITMQVKSRPKPEAFEAPGDGEIFREAIEAVNDAAKRAEDAGDKAAAAADDARGAAAQTAKHLEAVQGLAEQVETNADTVAQDKQAVAGMLSQTQQAASDAALSAQAAKLSETAAVQAQTGAEAAEDGARQYAEETGADRQAVANDKQVVSQMREAVAADRKAVEQTALQFGQTAQDALTAIGQAQSTAVGAVKAEGNKQTTAVQEAGTQAVKEVAEAKTTAVQAVTTEGDTQTKRVQDAAAGIVADREQIAANKQAIESKVDKQQGADNAGKALVVGKDGNVELGDAQTKTDPTLTQPGQAADAQVTGREIATLHQGKADAIVETAQGETVILTDSSDKLFEGLRVFGKSTQRTTTGAQLLSIKQEDVANKDGLSAKVNVDGGITVTGTPDKYATIYGKDIILSPGKYYLNGGNGSAGAVLLKARITFSDGSSKNCANGSFEVTPDTKSVSILIQYESATIQSVNYTIYPMLNKGETALPFEPYTGGKPSPNPEYPQEIVSAGEGGSIAVGVTGKNFATIDVDEYLKAGWQGRIEPINNGIKIIAINGWHMELLYIPFLAGKEITVSFTYRQIPEETSSQNTNNAFCFVNTNVYPNDSKDIKFKINSPSIDSTKVSCSFVARSAYLGFFIRLDKEGSDSGLKRTIEITNFQIELGNKETPYEPYTHQTLTLQTPNGLPGVPVTKDGNYTDQNGQQWVCDEIDLERGKYVQRVAIEKNNGGWELKPSSDTPGRFFQHNKLTNIFSIALKKSLCNIASFTSWGAPVNDKYAFALNGHGIYFSPPKGAEITAEELNAKLNSLSFPVVVVGELATPIERDLTPEEIATYKALRTYGPTTVITNDAGAGMEVTYVADTKAYIDKKFKELNQAIVNTQIALL